MYKVVILILSLVCGVRVGKAVEALPETTVASSFQLPFSRETQMKVRVADEAENCVVLGALKALDIKDRIDCIQDGELTA